MPTQTLSFSNANYRYLLQVASTRGVNLNKAINGIIDDERARKLLKSVKLERDVQYGAQGLLFDSFVDR